MGVHDHTCRVPDAAHLAIAAARRHAVLVRFTSRGGVGRGVGFHLTNLLLHVANTLLAYWLIFRLTGRPGIAAFVAATVRHHPLHVEWVTWVTEEKRRAQRLFRLAGVAGLCALSGKTGFGRMAAVATLFACSLMAKRFW